MLIDSHCHLDFFDEAELPALLDRAREAGVTELVTIGTRLTERHKQRHIAETHANVWCTIGVHPHNAAEHPTPDPVWIAAQAAHPRVIGIGESGLDYFYDKAPRPAQHASFRAHIRAARLADIPLIIHARDADSDVAATLEAATAAEGPFAFLLHCFSSGRDLAERALHLGGYISLSGILTFPKSHELRAMAAEIPLDRLLVETDAPYLAPVPFRGKRNEPAHTRHTAATLATLHHLTQDAMAAHTTQNFRRLFRKTNPDKAAIPPPEARL